MPSWRFSETTTEQPASLAASTIAASQYEIAQRARHASALNTSEAEFSTIL